MYQKIILASGSPRRRDLFAKLRVNFQYVTSEIKEEFNENVPVTDEVMRIAAMKAYNVSSIYNEAMVIGADTVVMLDGKIFGKPKNRDEAISMLKQLSGKTHEVITGVAIVNKREKICERFYDITKVTFKQISDELIEWYIDKEEPYDKAGAYAIQDTGNVLVKSIEGDFYNVVGLPISKIFDTFGKMEFMPYGGLHAIS